jgi:hypothetical protein
MAELVLSVIGVAPILVESIKALNALSTLVKTVKRCTKELGDVHLDLETQRVLFLNECTLLLQNIGEDHTMSRKMATDPGHANWEDSGAIECRIQRYLGHSYDLWKKIFAKIQEVVQEEINHLQGFEIIRSQKMKVGSDITSFQNLYLLLTRSNRANPGN